MTCRSFSKVCQPSEVHPPGIDAARHWYLFEQMRPFCRSNLAADMTCPKPTVPKPVKGLSHRPNYLKHRRGSVFVLIVEATRT